MKLREFINNRFALPKIVKENLQAEMKNKQTLGGNSNPHEETIIYSWIQMPNQSLLTASCISYLPSFSFNLFTDVVGLDT